jgi:hypothetical protein
MEPITIVGIAGGVALILAIAMFVVVPLENQSIFLGVTATIAIAWLIALIIVVVQYYRDKGLVTTDPTKDLDVYSGLMSPGPLACPTGDNTQLCDYYMASSAYSVIPSSTVFSYTTEEAIRKVIAAGARLVELHVYEEKNQPVVGLADTVTGEKYTYNTVPFESCCQVLANDAFNPGTTTASSDPFVVSVVFHTENTNVLNACAQIMKGTMRKYMLDSSFSYQRKVVPNEPVCDFAGKFIVVSGPGVKGTEMDELVNLTWGSSHLRRMTYQEASMTHDYKELIDFNRKGITMVVPDGSTSLENANPQVLFTYGCQWVMMNYGSLDKGMSTYTAQFAKASTILKPEELRFEPTSYQKPAPQDPSRSFQPKQQSTPIYTATI